MELIIENISMKGFSKICNSFERELKGFYVDKETDTVTVFLGDIALWEIDTYNNGVNIINLKNNNSITLPSHHFNKIIIQ